MALVVPRSAALFNEKLPYDSLTYLQCVRLWIDTTRKGGGGQLLVLQSKESDSSCMCRDSGWNKNKEGERGKCHLLFLFLLLLMKQSLHPSSLRSLPYCSEVSLYACARRV